ncbi:MAG TPA: phytoene/squalene synthase family protein, partial [Aggregicoccus sp.]|nr:phytoene/squalene synthase family protein [Aggregicoccus sp.]
MSPEAARHGRAVALARSTIAKHSRSFALASSVLPAGPSAEAAVVYSWCRRVDDAVDLAASTGAARAALERERSLLASLYAGVRPEDPVLAAFQDVLLRHHVPARYPFDLLAGMEMDVVGARYRSVDELLLYCYRVAGTVGLMMSHVMGVSEQRALRNACHLGIAMQLTNICRDVREDWERGRLYVPDQLLAEYGLGELRQQLGAPLPVQARAPLARAVQRLLELAEHYYRSGERGLAALSWRCSFAVRAARWIYAEIGRVLARRHFDVFSGRAVVSTPRKLLLLVRALLASARELP